MALTNPNIVIDTSFSSKNIASAASVYTFTASVSGLYYINVKLTNAAGNGDYIIYLKKQWGGTGTATVVLPKTTATAASGETVIEFVTIGIFAKATDVIDIYIDGLAGDTSVSGNIQIIANNYSLFDASADNVALSTTSRDAVVDAVWDEVLTGATHNVVSSAGRRLRQLASQVVWSGLAQGPGTNGNQIVLDTGASSMDGAYDPSLIAIVDGTGAGQCRLILQYAGSTRTATVDRDWRIAPDATSDFIIYANPGREHVNEGLARGGAASTITLNTSASSFDNEYVGQLVFIRSGNGQDQVRLVTAYNGTTKIATVSEPWDDIPDTTSGYVMLPNHIYDPGDIATAVWASGTRTLTSFGSLVANVWSYATRTLTSGGGSGGATPEEIWSYENRTLTSISNVVTEFWSNVPLWIRERLSGLLEDYNLEMYRGVTNVLSFTNVGNVAGATDIIFTVKNNPKDSNDQAIFQIRQASGLTILNGVGYAQPANGGNITITSTTYGNFDVTLEADPSNELIPTNQKFYDCKAIIGNKVKLLKKGRMTILPDISQL